MSFDPTGYSPDEPPRPDVPPMGGPSPYETPGLGSAQETARNRVMLPAIFLIVAGVLNLVGALGGFFFGTVYTAIPEGTLEEEMKRQNPVQYKQLKQQGMDVQDIVRIYIVGGFSLGCAGLITALISILGGVCMLKLRAFGLAVFASVVTAIPCLSPSACCFLGMVAGIWALVVLMTPEVRASFR
jgi:hypothetical protein